jgi:hypothetical protein
MTCQAVLFMILLVNLHITTERHLDPEVSGERSHEIQRA